VAVHLLGHRGARVPDEIGDGIDGYAGVTHDADEEVT
jgi:hypothetical protein